jgi:thiol-disulfide isomerase/thioredoxin
VRKAILPVFAALTVVAVGAVVFAVSAGALGPAVAAAPAASSRVPETVPAIPVDLTPLTAEEIREVGLSAVKPGTKIVDFELEDLGGKKVKLSSLAGKVVFLNFWATWCPPCRAEMPSMERLSAKLKDKGLVTLAVDLQEGKREVEGFVREYKLSFPVLYDRNGSAAGGYGVRSIPTTYIIARDGTILAGRIGGQEWDDPKIVAFFEKVLAR